MSNKLFLTAVILMLCTAVYAQPSIGHRFFGTVTINGASAPDGATVTAQIEGVTVSTGLVKNGQYGQTPANSFVVDDPNNNRAGKTVKFFVNGVDSGVIATYANGASNNRDLAISVSTPAPPPGNGGSGGGGGGGGGSTKPPVTAQVTNPAPGPDDSPGMGVTQGPCEEKWLCTDWSSCNSENLRSRTCEDVNKCGTEDTKPFESQICDTVPKAANAGFVFPITGLALDSPVTIGGIILLLAIAAFVGYKKMNKKAKSSAAPSFKPAPVKSSQAKKKK